MAKLLSGTDKDIVSENIRTLRAEGYSEAEATARASKHAQPTESGDPDESDESEAPDVDPEESGSSDRQFVIVTRDYSGLGWAKKLTEEGETVTLATRNPEEKPEHKKQFEMVAQGWLKSIPLSEALDTLQTDSTYWIFAENFCPEIADKLRTDGQKVFGTSTLSEKLEHDRQYAVDIAEKAGLPSPPTHEFSNLEEGLSFLDENTDKAYVFKPDDGGANYTTFVPNRMKDADANRQTYEYLAHMKEESGTYILQERIAQEDATEVCVEAWLYEGEPFITFMGLEVKRKNTYDLGEMAGCGGDFNQVIPLESELVKQTIGLLFPFYKEQAYTGFVDVNVLFTKDGQPHFLEVCNRFGYNSHPNLFINLALDGFGSIMADYIDGKIDGMQERFKSGVGTTLTLFLDHPRLGLPVHIDPQYAEQFYPFDGSKDDDSDTLMLTGYSEEVGIFCAYAETMEAAAQDCLESIIHSEAVSYPDMHYRMDLGGTDYYNAPLLRYKKLKKMGLL